jgi:hypothetical protein
MAVIDNDNRAAIAQRVVEESGLPLAPTGRMIVALSNHSLLFWQERGWLRRLHFLGRTPIQRIECIEGKRGEPRRQFAELAGVFLLTAIFVAASDHLDQWILYVFGLAIMGLATVVEFRAEYSCNSVFIFVDGCRIWLSTPRGDDPVGFAASFTQAKQAIPQG